METVKRAWASLTRSGGIRADLLTQSGGTILSQLIPIAISPLLTRIFSPVDFGLYGTVVSISTLLAILITLRVDHGIMVTGDDDQAKNIALLSLTLAVIGALVFAVLSALFLAIAGMVETRQILIWTLFSPLAGLLAAAMRTLTLFSNRLKAFRAVSRARIVQAASVGAASLGLGYLGQGNYGLILALLIGNLLYVLLLGRALWPPVAIDFKRVLSLLRENGRFVRFSLPADLVNTLSSRIPFIVFPALYGLEQTGYLTLAYRVIATPARFVGTAIGEVFYSYAAREYERAGSCWRPARKIALLLGGLGLVGFSVLFVVAEPLFVFVFGEEWRPAATFTQILTPMLLIGFVVSPLSVVFYITARQKEDFLWQVAFLAVTTLACFTGIWAGGAIGSLVAYSAAGAALYLVYYALIRRYAVGNR